MWGPRSQIKCGPARSTSTDHLQQKFLKLQREVKRVEPLHVLNGGSHLKTFYLKWGFLRRNTTHLRLSSSGAGRGSDSLHFWSHYHGENLWKRLEKSSKLYRKHKSFRRESSRRWRTVKVNWLLKDLGPLWAFQWLRYAARISSSIRARHVSQVAPVFAPRSI